MSVVRGLANFASLSWKLDNPYYHEQPGLESDPSSAISGLPGNVNLELLQQATSYLNSGISGSGSDAGSAVNEDPGFHEHVNSLRDTMFYVCQVCKLDLSMTRSWHSTLIGILGGSFD